MKIVWKNPKIAAIGNGITILFLFFVLAASTLEIYYFSRMDYRMPDEVIGRVVPYEIKHVIYYLTSLQWQMASYSFYGFIMSFVLVVITAVVNEYALESKHDK